MAGLRCFDGIPVVLLGCYAMVHGMAHHSGEFSSLQQAFDNARRGDVLIVDREHAGQAVTISRNLDAVQVYNLDAPVQVEADIVDCLFYQSKVNLIQRSGRVRRTIFYHPHYSCDFQFNHADSVMIYWSESYCKPKSTPRMQFYGFVRAVTVSKFRIEGLGGTDPATGWAYTYAPVVAINATHPEGNGYGTYLLSPIVWDQRTWTPFKVYRGRGITLAHVNTEYNRLADPIMDILNGVDCMLLCNGVGAAKQAGAGAYEKQPLPVVFPWGSELAQPYDDVPFRGAAFNIAGQRNRSVANGDYKTWSLGRRSWLPCMHYGDQVVAMDPFFRQFPNKRGILTANFSEPRNVMIMGPGLTDHGNGLTSSNRSSPYRYPFGADIIRPTLLRVPDLAIANKYVLGKQHRILRPSDMAFIERSLQEGATVQLGAGAYHFGRTLTRGKIVGAGKGTTILRFPASLTAARTPFAGFVNCTVENAAVGYEINDRYNPSGLPKADNGCEPGMSCYSNTGQHISQDFTNARFSGCEVGILIDGNSQNDIIEHAEFVGGTHGIKTGSIAAGGGRTGDPSIDKIDIVNCDFSNLGGTAINLVTDGAHTPNGQVAIHGCTFTDIGEAAIYVKGGQTHLIQACTITRAKKTQADGAIIYAQSFAGYGGLALSHIDIDNTGVAGNHVGIDFNGVGCVSHGTIKGVATAIRKNPDSKGENSPLVVDHIDAPGGALVHSPGTVVAKSRFSNLDAGNTVRIEYDGAWFDAKGLCGEQPLDQTPPPEVGNVRVTQKSGYNLVEWDSVVDPESGVNNYAIYANGRELGRSCIALPDDASRKDPFAPRLTVCWYRDSTRAAHAYTVRAINGAHLLSGGGEAPLREWRQVGAWFYDGAGNQVLIRDINAADSTVTDGNGKTVRWADLAPPRFPRYIVLTQGKTVDHSAFQAPYYGFESRAPARETVAPEGMPLIDWRRGIIVSRADGHAVLRLYSLDGRLVGTLFDGDISGGTARFTLDRRIARGVHLSRLRWNGYSAIETVTMRSCR